MLCRASLVEAPGQGAGPQGGQCLQRSPDNRPLEPDKRYPPPAQPNHGLFPEMCFEPVLFKDLKSVPWTHPRHGTADLSRPRAGRAWLGFGDNQKNAQTAIQTAGHQRCCSQRSSLLRGHRTSASSSLHAVQKLQR